MPNGNHGHPDPRHVAELEQKVEERDERIDWMQRKLSELQAEIGQLAGDHNLIDERDEIIREARHKNDHLNHRIMELEDCIESAIRKLRNREDGGDVADTIDFLANVIDFEED